MMTGIVPTFPGNKRAKKTPTRMPMVMARGVGIRLTSAMNVELMFRMWAMVVSFQVVKARLNVERRLWLDLVRHLSVTVPPLEISKSVNYVHAYLYNI